MLRTALLVLSTLAPATLPAQPKIWIVDKAMGAGAHYAALQPALDAAAAGDLIVLRAGMFTGQFKVSKGVSIHGRPGASITVFSRFDIGAVPQQETFCIANLELGGILEFRDCRGLVLLDRIDQGDFRFINCANVAIQSSTPALLQFSNSQAVMSNCVVKSHGRPYPLIYVLASEVTIAGGYYENKGPPHSISRETVNISSQGILRLTGDQSTKVVSIGRSAQPAIQGTGTVLLDPRVSLVGNNHPGTGPGIRLINQSTPYLRSDSASLGAPVQVEMFGGANHAAVLALGLPTAPIPLPAFQGRLWIDPRVMIILPPTTLDAQGNQSWGITIPNAAHLLGLSVVWQGLSGPAGAAPVLSNPVHYTHGL